MTVALTIRSTEVPAASRMAETFFKHCLVCSWIVFPTIFPVTGSCGPVPETNTRPAARTAWLYVGGGAGALGVRIISLGIKFLHSGWKSHFGNFNITDQVYGRHLSHLPQMVIGKRYSADRQRAHRCRISPQKSGRGKSADPTWSLPRHAGHGNDLDE
jgi:hypothetical protein